MPPWSPPDRFVSVPTDPGYQRIMAEDARDGDRHYMARTELYLLLLITLCVGLFLYGRQFT